VPEKVYTVDFEANTTIADFKSSTDMYRIINDDIIIKGTIISSDKFGSFYKEIIIQDSTGGIKIKIDGYDMYKKFPEGEMVYVKCKGLVLGEPKGLKEIAFPANGSTFNIPFDIARREHVFRNDGEGKKIIPKVLKITDLTDNHLNTLVKLEGVEFIAGDTSEYFIDFTDSSETKNGADRTIIDFSQNEFVVRISPYFYNDDLKTAKDSIWFKVPKGNGNITAIYSKYRSYYQLVINELESIDFEEGNRIINPLDISFYSNLGSFNSVSVIGDNQEWKHSTQYHCAIMSGYSGGANNNEDWLISPSIDMTNFSIANLMFSHAGKLYGSSWDNATVQVSKDYDGTSLPSEQGTWTEITVFEKPTGWTFINSGKINMDEYCGNSSVYVAFKYISNSSTALKWEIESVKVTAK